MLYLKKFRFLLECSQVSKKIDPSINEWCDIFGFLTGEFVIAMMFLILHPCSFSASWECGTQCQEQAISNVLLITNALCDTTEAMTSQFTTWSHCWFPGYYLSKQWVLKIWLAKVYARGGHCHCYIKKWRWFICNKL